MEKAFDEQREVQLPILFPDRRASDRRRGSAALVERPVVEEGQGILFERRRVVHAPQANVTTAVEHGAVSALDSLLPTFTLLVNGKDLDTGKYDYVPHADALIKDFRTTLQVIKQLKAGTVPEHYQQYVFARYCVGAADTNRKAMEAADEASKEFRYFSLSQRLRIMRDIYDLLLAQRERLIELMIIEGHPRRLAEWEFSGMEQLFRKQSLDFYRDHLSRKVGVNGREMLYWKRKPDGVVCVSPPKNAPSSTSLIAAFALLGGNTLILKPPLKAPISTLFLWRNVVHQALDMRRAPPGTLNVVLGNSVATMDEWITSPHVSDILFIGDSKVGLEIGHRVFQAGKKPILELSGNDMMFVWKDAALAEAVQSLLDGFLGSMQICMVPKKAFIHEDVYEAFEKAFLAEVGTLRMGLPSDPHVTLTPVIRINEFYQFLEDATGKGAELLCGGQRVNHQMVADKDGNFITPAVIRIHDTARAREMRCVQEENFFPLMPLVKVSAQDVRNGKSRDMVIFKQMVAMANSNAYGLRASVWVNSPFYIQRFMDHIHNSGLLRINSPHVGFSPYLATHGGTGKTGGPYGELNYVWEKTTHLQGVSVTGTMKRTT